ncbi:hypothetical protein P1X15_07015 [Runella sp. MFBS21]|uniref:hypothetical protein n=1 Tax=Runella sp. MFBS21 TaxID=3034018 RepID=UPI0023F8A387|nr:hypothetical protein [Runella sp. MFBS21]MDF7817339.1 hypothetical protein [Runella sp. MFBS21]
MRLTYLLQLIFAFHLLGACQSSDMAQKQTDNMNLTKKLHKHLNRQDWRSVEELCAEKLHYRGHATHFADVEESKARFVRRYQTLMGKAKSFEVRQLYPAGRYHVIVEGIVEELPDSSLAVCLIYTIEDKHITRLYAYE